MSVRNEPDMTLDELCALHPGSAEVIRMFVNKPGLHPYEALECVACGRVFERLPGPKPTYCGECWGGDAA